MLKQTYHWKKNFFFKKTNENSWKLQSEWVIIVLDQYTDLDFYNASSLKQQAVCRHVAQLAYIIRFRANQSLLLLLSAACLAENQFF